MSQLMGVVNLTNESKDMQDLTIFRCFASVPFGGRYRFIDFMLSSMVNSDVSNVAILANKKYTSLMDHLKNGKSWDLNRKRDGLFLLPPADYDNFPGMVGDIKNFYWHLDYFYRSTQEYVVITGSHILANIDFRNVLQKHIDVDADITVVYTARENFRSQMSDAYARTIVCDDDGFVSQFDEGIRETEQNVSMEIYLMKRSFLIEMIESSMIKGYTDLVEHALIKNLHHYRVFGYEHKDYIAPIFSISDYYYHSLQLLNSELRNDFFHRPGIIYTKVKDEPPSKYSKEAVVVNSLVANGCHIEGQIENSILFRGVKVHPGASIRNCIIMQRCEISEQAVLENVILDKEVFVTKGGSLIGNKDRPAVVSRRMVI